MWYYAQGQEQIGPLDEAAFKEAVEQGQVGPDTLVWREGMAEWLPWYAAKAQMGATQAGSAPASSAASRCVECGNAFPVSEMLYHQGNTICAACKPRYFQRIQEGGAAPGLLRYGGFWIRFAAYFIDYLIMTVVGAFTVMPIMNAVFFSKFETETPGEEDLVYILSVLPIMYLSGFLLLMLYKTFFLGRFGATPGKMALGLKVVRPDGTAITYGRALGRSLAEMLSSFILGIGYLMIAFDGEKRSLHDRIADTRVIKA